MSRSAAEPPGWRPARIVVGRAGRPHGLDGSVHVDGAGGAVTLRSGMEVEIGPDPARVEAVKGTAERPIVRFSVASDREAAAALRGRDVTVPASALPEPEDDEWYHVDLVGCEVVSGEVVVGAVRDVLSYPANDVLVVTPPPGGDDMLVPFVDDVVLRVDVPGRRIEIRADFLP